MKYFSTDFNQFFRELAANNTKNWFDENRKRYEKSVKVPFNEFVGVVLEALALQNPKIKEVLPKDCVFRINRDVRFSKDKTPYKLTCSAIVGPTGKKGFSSDSIYFELGPEHVRFYAGIYELEKEELNNIRMHIASNIEEFQKLYTEPSFQKLFGTVRGEKNKLLPKELKEKATLEPLLYNKQFYFFAQFPANLLETEKLLPELLNAFEVSRPLQRFLIESKF